MRWGLSTVFLVLGCNFHEVDQGRFYRSGQLTGQELEQAISAIGLKTVINLRGAQPQQPWYQEEVAVTRRMGVRQIDIPMSALRLPHRRDLIRLLDSFRDAPRPILLHCKQGADRTGEATALYQMIYMGQTREEALNALTTAFNHFSAIFPAKRYFIREVWQGEEWARREYNPCLGEYFYYDPESSVCKDPNATVYLSAEEDT